MIPASASDLRGKVFSVLLIIVVIMVVSAVIVHKLWFREKKYVIGYVDPNPEEKEGAQGVLRNMPKHGYNEG